jgi:hypothetical protein
MQRRDLTHNLILVLPELLVITIIDVERSQFGRG